MAVNPFDLVRAINDKTNVDNPALYNPFLSNRAFSYHLDTVLVAAEMNKYPDLPAEVQFAFMNSAVRKGRRYSAWYKEDESPHLQMVMDYYGYSKNKALAALQVLTRDNLRDISKRMDKGGR